MTNSALSSVAALGAMFLTIPIAFAQDTICTGVLSGTVYGNVIVPNGQTCILQTVAVTGNVSIGLDSNLHTVAPGYFVVRIAGNVLGESCGRVDLVALSRPKPFPETPRVEIGGNVELLHCKRAGLFRLKVGGNGQFVQNADVYISNTTFGGNLMFEANTVSDGARAPLPIAN